MEVVEVDNRNNPPAHQAMDASAVVSEDAAGHSSDDEDHEWLAHASFPSPSHPSRLARVDEQTRASSDDNRGQQLEVDSDDDDMIDKKDADALYYSANMDDEDEAWVYKHLRGGEEQPVYVRVQQTKPKYSHSNNDEDITGEENKDGTQSETEKRSSTSAVDARTNQFPEQIQKALLLKPRFSDAVLSCPRCFTTVCMDCQQHEKYANQYRAMFVMNIGVDWNKRMIYDEACGGLKLVSPSVNNSVVNVDSPNRIPHDFDGTENKDKEMYHSVHCGYCQYDVAALDMKTEIYYFYGCIASG
eukprot:scaffold19621_cov63-Cyclotella_meneghiniana.AAC.2